MTHLKGVTRKKSRVLHTFKGKISEVQAFKKLFVLKRLQSSTCDKYFLFLMENYKTVNWMAVLDEIVESLIQVS